VGLLPIRTWSSTSAWRAHQTCPEIRTADKRQLDPLALAGGGCPVGDRIHGGGAFIILKVLSIFVPLRVTDEEAEIAITRSRQRGLPADVPTSAARVARRGDRSGARRHVERQISCRLDASSYGCVQADSDGQRPRLAGRCCYGQRVVGAIVGDDDRDHPAGLVVAATLFCAVSASASAHAPARVVGRCRARV